MSRFRARRVLGGAFALAWVIVAVFGAYSCGKDYSQQRGSPTRVRLPRAGTGRLLRVNFYSRSLHRNADYLAYLPPGL